MFVSRRIVELRMLFVVSAVMSLLEGRMSSAAVLADIDANFKVFTATAPTCLSCTFS